MNPIAALRQRLGAVLTAAALSAGCGGCGALMAFVMAPGQALEASRVARLPLMDAASVEAAAAGEAILITGVLAGNPPLLAGATSLVAYTEEEWQVSAPSNDDENSNGDPHGTWKTVEPVDCGHWVDDTVAGGVRGRGVGGVVLAEALRREVHHRSKGTILMKLA